MVEIFHGVGEVIGKVVAHEARIVEHEVHLHVPAVDFGEGGIDFGFTFEVTAHGAHFHAVLLDFFHHRFGMGLVAALQDDVRTEFSHLDSGETAHTTAAAGNQGPLALNVNHNPSFAPCAIYETK